MIIIRVFWLIQLQYKNTVNYELKNLIFPILIFLMANKLTVISIFAKESLPLKTQNLIQHFLFSFGLWNSETQKKKSESFYRIVRIWIYTQNICIQIRGLFKNSSSRQWMKQSSSQMITINVITCKTMIFTGLEVNCAYFMILDHFVETVDII